MGITVREIAQLVGVSPATVSRAFKPDSYVDSETRSRIIAIAQEKGFSPRAYRKNNSMPYNSCIGVVVPDIGNAYYAEVIHGIESVMDANSVQVLICNSNEESGSEIKILHSLSQLNVKGLIVCPVSNTVEYNTQYLISLNSSGTPVVLIDRDLRNGNLDGVFMDNYGGAYASIKAFIDCGHKNIAFISGPTTSTSGLDRLNAYMAALRDSGIAVNEEYILYGDFMSDSAYNLTKKLFERHHEVTAVFASNRRMASGCLMALAEKNLVVGKDVSFISCGNPGYRASRISYVDYPTVSIGEECANMLLYKIMNGKRNSNAYKKRTTFDMELVLQGSERLEP